MARGHIVRNVELIGQNPRLESRQHQVNLCEYSRC